jgi:hypothetical protein
LIEVANCDLKDSTSSSVNWNIKSPGNLAIFRRTCSLSRLVLTPYSTARSASLSALAAVKQNLQGKRSVTTDQLKVFPIKGEQVGSNAASTER